MMSDDCTTHVTRSNILMCDTDRHAHGFVALLGADSAAAGARGDHVGSSLELLDLVREPVHLVASACATLHRRHTISFIMLCCSVIISSVSFRSCS